MPEIKQTRQVLYKEKWYARRMYLRFKSSVMLYIWASVFFALVSPALLITVIVMFLLAYEEKIYRQFFFSKDVEDIYRKMFQPQMSATHYVAVGFEVPTDQVYYHMKMVKDIDVLGVNPPDPVKEPVAYKKYDKLKNEVLSYLKGEENYVKKIERHREIGFSKTQLTTHFWILGTTGAGKTSMIMTLIEKQAEQGGGVIFVDGKSDVKMFFKLYNIMKKVGREHDVYVINFLPIENYKTHTNTFNPIADLPPGQVIEFLTSLMGEASGDMAYWQGRGKALLAPVVGMLAFRRKYYKENFTISVVSEYLSNNEKLTFLSAVFIAMIKAYEYRLRKNPMLTPLFKKALTKQSNVNPVLSYIDAFDYYFKTYPGDLILFQEAGENYLFLEEIYKVYKDITSFISQIAQFWMDFTQNLAKGFNVKLEDKILDLSMDEILAVYDALKKENPKEYKLDTSNPESIKAFQQLSYAQQQWTDIMTSLNSYSNIFGSLEPEVDLVDVIRNQKVLYVLLPPLKQSKQTTNLLGKILLRTIATAVSTALGEALHNITDEQRDVLAARLTPIPLGLVILDEYGAYPIGGLDTILAQVRSINISVVLSTQDITSARAEGTDENSLKRVFANTQKVVLRIQDEETLQKLESMMYEEKTLTNQIMMEENYGFLMEDVNYSLGSEKVFNPQLLRGFKNGFGMIITDETPVLTQFYFVDPPGADKIVLNKSVQFLPAYV
ncbi:MAG TPA: DUF87 domain-containing protein [Thermodesulfobium narugense]|nr:DUF87 domain-containing protein [Thermodesulfobium narugense]